LLSISVVGEDADPIKNGRARSAPTTRKTAKNTYERGRLRMDLGFEGEALIILGFLLGGLNSKMSHAKRPCARTSGRT
jgi:hypothetical protein